MNEEFEFDLSVIIPTLGRPSLHRAVSSIKEPGLKIQLIIISAGPEYSTAISNQLSEYDHLFLISEKASSAFQRDLGVEAATGKYIAFLDDDDEWAEKKCLTQISLIEASENPPMALAGARIKFRRSSHPRLISLSSPDTPTSITLSEHLLARKRLLYPGNSFGSSSLLGPSNLIRKVKWFDEGVGHDDWGYLLRLAASAPNIYFVIDQQPLATVYQNSINSVSKNTSFERSEAFLRTHRTKIESRSAADFWLLHVLAKKIISKNIKIGDLFYPGYRLGIPHLASIIKFLITMISRINSK